MGHSPVPSSRISYQPPTSQWVDLDGPVHYVDHGGPADGPLLLCVHGLGGSLLNWAALAPRLTGTARVVAVDLAGFGHTRRLLRSASVWANQRLLHRFLTELLAGPAILVGNSMGGLITSLQANAHPETVAGAVLIDPALPMVVGARPDPLVTATFAMYAVPPLGRLALRARRKRRSPEQSVMDLLRLCCVDVDRVPSEVLEQHLASARVRRTYSEVDDAMLTAARSLLAALSRRRRHAALLTAMRSPVLLMHGDKDRLVPVASARAAAKANPGWRFEVAHGVGHVPQLEVPDWTAERILDWLVTDAATAAELTRHTPAAADPMSTDPRGITE
jgi:pimeloyl-ACP methyl ester carboxylesterase